ncbi:MULTISPECIES: hypothetical protein [Pirellulaceae]|uniref:hypothetical protein n=1 Tax=Pirellulaceae TaxID=2691357 RepID=UPI001304BE51|nr:MULTISPECIES: hypothetical protein [Pirellulaceae]
MSHVSIRSQTISEAMAGLRVGKSRAAVTLSHVLLEPRKRHKVEVFPARDSQWCISNGLYATQNRDMRNCQVDAASKALD